MIYHVCQNSQPGGDGSELHPFRTINEAAQLAWPGDTILIGSGTYREWVRPLRGGRADNERIAYKNKPGTRPVITGAEIIGNWMPCQKGIWQTSVPNTMFDGYHPYRDTLSGDWYQGYGQIHHTGNVLLNGMALREAASLDALLEEHSQGKNARLWYAVAEENSTSFYADFGDINPNENCTEVLVRPFCFFPENTGINYITVSGLTLCCAATQWAPPTAFQAGIIGPHWSCGWIIEDCVIHDSKCCGISLGKKKDLKDNIWSLNPSKPGSQTYTEIICSNIRDGWSKERIGSHIVRNNTIYNCGQAGIVGNMGGAFCTVSGNHIYHINDRSEFGGAEIAGIKLHAAIDTIVENNVIHSCTRGLWLDWEAQGAIVRKNVFFDNFSCEDFFIEVCHGPCLVENNLFLSPRSVRNVSQGTAFVHNLFAGKIYAAPDTKRFTLYHLPHSTMLGGVMLVYGGDDRMLNNIFAAPDNPADGPGRYGTACYDHYSYLSPKTENFNDTPMTRIGDTFSVTVRDNLYLNGAESWEHEENRHIATNFNARIHVREEDGHYYLYTNLGETAEQFRVDRVTGGILGRAFESDQAFEYRDGTPICIDEDFCGTSRGDRTSVGPFEHCDRKILLI